MSEMYLINFDDDYLEHHGIKGQEWGVRNAEWYPIAAYKASTNKDKSKLLNKMDDSLSNDKYDYQNAKKKADTYSYKIKKLNKKIEKDPDKSDKYSSKISKYSEKADQYNAEADKYKKNVETGQAEINKLISQYQDEGLTVKSTKIARVAYKGEAIAKNMLGVAGGIAMAGVAGYGVATYGYNRVQGNKYKVKDSDELKADKKNIKDLDYNVKTTKTYKDAADEMWDQIGEHDDPIKMINTYNIKQATNKNYNDATSEYQKALDNYNKKYGKPYK